MWKKKKTDLLSEPEGRLTKRNFFQDTKSSLFCGLGLFVLWPLFYSIVTLPLNLQKQTRSKFSPLQVGLHSELWAWFFVFRHYSAIQCWDVTKWECKICGFGSASSSIYISRQFFQKCIAVLLSCGLLLFTTLRCSRNFRKAVWLILTNVFSTFPALLRKLILCTDHQGSCKMLLEY